MFASSDIRSVVSRALSRCVRSRLIASDRGYGRRRIAGATLALLGFVSQYPIPVIHRCPVMNPHGIALFGDKSDDSHDHHEHAPHSRGQHSHNHHHSASHAAHSHSHGDGQHSEIHAAVAAMPPCHRALAASRGPSAHSHKSHSEDAGHGAKTRAGDEAGHSHDSCPVCQGHAQLLQDLPAPALPSLATLFQLELRVPDFVEAPRAFFLSILPPARAPPLRA